MKRTIIAFLTITSVILISSCSSRTGLPEEMKTRMATFETDWTKATETMTSWGTEMTKTMGELTEMINTNMNIDMSKIPAAMTSKADSLKNVCNNIATSMTEMKTTYESAMNTWATDQAGYFELKAKAEKGEIKGEALTASLQGYMDKLTAATAGLENWKTTLQTMQANCTATCDAMKALMPM